MRNKPWQLNLSSSKRGEIEKMYPTGCYAMNVLTSLRIVTSIAVCVWRFFRGDLQHPSSAYAGVQSFKYHRQIHLHFFITFTIQPIHIKICRSQVYRSSFSSRVREWKIYRIPITHVPRHRVKPARKNLTQITLFLCARLPVLTIIKQTPVKTYLVRSISNSVRLVPIFQISV